MLITMLNALGKYDEGIIKWFKSHPSPPLAIVSDFFLGWTNKLASRLGIHHLVFAPCSAFSYCIFQNLWQDTTLINATINGDKDDNMLISLPNIPNVPIFSWFQLPQVWRSFKLGQPDYELFKSNLLANMTSFGVLVNTFENMECVYIDHLKKQVGHDRVWDIGPSLDGKHGSMNECYDGLTSSLTLDDVLRWLDKKPDESVVYICFGTRGALTKQEMLVLVDALDHSKVNFILCAKPQDSSNIPYGFEERVNDRGLVIRDWIPQFDILKHPAVGSFLNNCGWNSILEGVKAGVMMLAWPMGSDQFANAKLLVDELGVGKHVCTGRHMSVRDSMEFGKLLHDSVDGDTPERVKVKKLSQAMKNRTPTLCDLDKCVNFLSNV